MEQTVNALQYCMTKFYNLCFNLKSNNSLPVCFKNLFDVVQTEAPDVLWPLFLRGLSLLRQNEKLCNDVQVAITHYNEADKTQPLPPGLLNEMSSCLMLLIMEIKQGFQTLERTKKDPAVMAMIQIQSPFAFNYINTLDMAKKTKELEIAETWLEEFADAYGNHVKPETINQFVLLFRYLALFEDLTRHREKPAGEN